MAAPRKIRPTLVSLRNQSRTSFSDWQSFNVYWPESIFTFLWDPGLTSAQSLDSLFTNFTIRCHFCSSFFHWRIVDFIHWLWKPWHACSICEGANDRTQMHISRWSTLLLNWHRYFDVSLKKASYLYGTLSKDQFEQTQKYADQLFPFNYW